MPLNSWLPTGLFEIGGPGWSIGEFSVVLAMLFAGGWLCAKIALPRKISARCLSDNDYSSAAPTALLLQVAAFEGDQYGRAGEALVNRLRAYLPRQVQIQTGLLKRELIFSPGANDRPSMKSQRTERLKIDGDTNGRRLRIVVSEIDDGLANWSCTRFPLNVIEGLSSELPRPHVILAVTAILGKYCVGADQSFTRAKILSDRQLVRYGNELAKSGQMLAKTQKDLAFEMLVAAGWCFLQLGVRGGDAGFLKASLMNYEAAGEFDWRLRDAFERANIRSNMAMLHLQLAGIENAGLDGRANEHADQSLVNTAHALRYYRRDTSPLETAALSLVAAKAYSLMMPGAKLQSELTGLSNGLNEAIAYWQGNDEIGELAECYLVQGKLALSAAKTHMGLQDWERAENALLLALNVAKTRERRGQMAGLSDQLDRINMELSEVYLSRAARFGDADYVHKALRLLKILNEPKSTLNVSQRAAAARSIALCHLNLGGLTHDAGHLKLALAKFNDILDVQRHSESSREVRKVIRRYICVARARLALIEGNGRGVKQAISELSAVMGHKLDAWPYRDVLLRLRARLRQLQFSLDGNDISLDRAVQDRRELVQLASGANEGLRFAVEVGELVWLLTRRQYKARTRLEDFHEAHYLLERAIVQCEQGVFEESDDGPQFDVTHIEASLHLKMAKLLASYARTARDEKALVEATYEFEAYLGLTPRNDQPIARAGALNELGQILMDRSEQYGFHKGLIQAAHCFAESYDIYLAANQMDQANRQRRFFENAEAAIVGYRVPHYDPLSAPNVVVVRPKLKT